MTPTVEVRRQAFATWVQRVLTHAKTSRGLSVVDIAKMAGIGNPTIYRWKNGQGKELPQPEQVVAFCDALDIDPVVPFGILWPGKNQGALAPEPMPLDPDLQTLMRKVMDPGTSEFEREFIRETLRQLADRPANPARIPQRGRRTGGIKN